MVGLDCTQASYTTASPEFTYRFEYAARNLESGQWFFHRGVARLSFPDEVPLRGLFNTTFVGEGIRSRDCEVKI